jgi:cytochrome c oxidase subunit III
VMFTVSVLFAVAFLVIKGFEYGHHFETGALPGKYYALEELPLRGASLFFTLYFFMTGLHAIHVLAGMGLLIWVGARAFRGEFSAAYFTPVELSGMYWHLVDLVWIFLYPLLYLI